VKKRQSKCLVVEASELIKQSYMVNPNTSMFSLQGNYVNEVESGQKIFERYNIPKEFQKIFIELKLFAVNVEYPEYAMGFPFDLTIMKDEHDKAKKYIEGHNRCEIYNNLIMGNNISFKTGINVVSEDVVRDFFKRLNDQGYLPLYLQIVKDLFWDISLDEMLGIWNEHQGKDRQVKIREMKKQNV